MLKKSQTLKSTSCANSVAGLGKEEALLSVALSPLDGTTMGASLDVSGLPRLALPHRADIERAGQENVRLRRRLSKLDARWQGGHMVMGHEVLPPAGDGGRRFRP